MKRIASFTIILLLLITTAGCSGMSHSDLKHIDVTVVTPEGTLPGAPTSVPDSSKGDTGSDLSSDIASGTVDEELLPEVTDEAIPTESIPTPEVYATYRGSLDIPEGITDVNEIYEYLRNQLITNADYYDSLDNSTVNTWSFKRMKDHTPSGSYEEFKISDYNCCYYDANATDDDKVIYLTFDCGYPSDRTVAILDTLKKHNAKANFFVTKMYLKKCADYAIRMKEEGHAVCNHTVNHTDLRYMSVEKIAAEIFDCAEYFYEVTGYEFDPYFRTPSGAYTKKLLTIINDAGYKTVFWSIAYGDYDTANQPAPGYVTNHFETYHHNGAIALMHNDSQSNVDELDAVLTLLEEEGYRFALLSELDD